MFCVIMFEVVLCILNIKNKKNEKKKLKIAPKKYVFMFEVVLCIMYYVYVCFKKNEKNENENERKMHHMDVCVIRHKAYAFI